MLQPIISICMLAIISNCKLYQVYSIARHGARFHVIDLYDSNSTKNYEGQLTFVGMRQQQKFGELIRRQYIDDLGFLSSKYNKSEIQALSTHTNRTTQSIQSFLYGLYPPSTGQLLTKVNQSLYEPPYSQKQTVKSNYYALPYGYQPIIVNNTEISISYDCANYQFFAEQNFNKIGNQISQMNYFYRPFIERMSRMFGFPLTNQLDNLLYLTRVFDVANVDRHLGRLLPDGFTEDDFRNVQHFSNWYFMIEAGGQNTLISNVMKFGKVFREFDNRIKDIKNYPLKWTFISGHDFDLMAMHMAMKTSSPQCIEEIARTGSTSAIECEKGSNDFVGSLIIELHLDDQTNFYVKVKSQGKYLRLCSRSQYECKYQQFKKLVSESMTQENIDKICGNSPHYPVKVYKKHVSKSLRQERR